MTSGAQGFGTIRRTYGRRGGTKTEGCADLRVYVYAIAYEESAEGGGGTTPRNEHTRRKEKHRIIKPQTTTNHWRTERNNVNATNIMKRGKGAKLQSLHLGATSLAVYRKKKGMGDDQ